MPIDRKLLLEQAMASIASQAFSDLLVLTGDSGDKIELFGSGGCIDATIDDTAGSD